MVKRAVTLAVTVGGMMLPALPALAQLSPAAAPSAAALSDIPPSYLTLYIGAARTCPGLPWQVLAAIGSIESDHGRSTAADVHGPTGYASVEGPMQFEPSTFAEYAVQADPRRPVSPYDPADAIYSAARMLCAAGARGGSESGLYQAIYAYNHAGWYVNDVLGLARRYSGPVAESKPAVRPKPTPRPKPAAHPAPTARPAAPASPSASATPAVPPADASSPPDVPASTAPPTLSPSPSSS